MVLFVAFLILTFYWFHFSFYSFVGCRVGGWQLICLRSVVLGGSQYLMMAAAPKHSRASSSARLCTVLAEDFSEAAHVVILPFIFIETGA